MEVTLKQVSSLEKIRPIGIGDISSVSHATVMGGESFSYQIALQTPIRTAFRARVESPLQAHVSLYAVVNTVMDVASYVASDDDYITKEPGIMPDMLLPLEGKDAIFRLACEAGAIWVKVDVPENTPAGVYPVTVKLNAETRTEAMELEQTMELEVIGVNLPAQQTLFTQWLHVDCIADAHGVDIYSEEHWALIEKYIALARQLGINMLLTPVITPPLDTEIGSTRPCTQLVKITRENGSYRFDFTLLKRWVEMCNRQGIQYFEISHLFSQWGLAYAPNIRVAENGEESYLFGWHTPAQSPEYREFLGLFLPSLVAWMKAEGIKDRCWFHISDEPHSEHVEAYRYAHDVIVPLIDGCTTFDALSDYAFYENGLVQIPVTKSDHIEAFLEHKLDRQWVYYCCSQNYDVGNRYYAQPSYRNRILGLQIYKYGIEGFLHWGFNFYYSKRSRRFMNPFLCSSGDKGYPSGDTFSVYPWEDGVVPSLRAVIFKEALADIEVCRTLEKYIGKAQVVAMIEEEAGMELTFSQYPRRTDFIPALMEKMHKRIQSYL